MNGQPKALSKTPTFEEWRQELVDGYTYEVNEGRRDHNHQPTWRPLGSWLYNAKENSIYTHRHMVYHMCTINYQRVYAEELGIKGNLPYDSVQPIENGCYGCGAQVPEGMRIVMMMEKM